MQFIQLIYCLLLTTLLLYYEDGVIKIVVLFFFFYMGIWKQKLLKRTKETKGKCIETSKSIVHNRTTKHQKAESEPPKNNLNVKKASKGFMPNRQLLRKN